MTIARSGAVEVALTSNRRAKRMLGLAATTALALSLLLARRRLWPTAAESLHDFYVSDAPEESLLEPLIRAGSGVVPLVLAQLPNQQMPRRRYAIEFLGQGRYVEALPALRTILTNQAESELFRGDALRAICRINAAEGKQTASQFAVGADYLSTSAREIIAQGCAK